MSTENNILTRNISSRIALKIDTWENWNSLNMIDKESGEIIDTAKPETHGDLYKVYKSGGSYPHAYIENAHGALILNRGEIGLCEIGSNPDEGSNEVTNPPTVLFKVGDGETPFCGLKWASALAADVYGWAKVSSANIVEISYGSGQNEKKSTLSEFLQAFETYKTSNDQAITSINNSITALTEATTDTSKTNSLASRLAVVEGLAGIGDEGSTGSLATIDYVDEAIDDAKEALVGSSTVTGVVSTIQGASAQAIAAQSTADEAKTWINNNKTNLEKVSADPITSTEVATAISNHNTNVKHITETEMSTAISNADNTLETKLKGTSTSDTVATTIAGASDKAEAAATAANNAQVDATEALNKANTLIGSDANKSVREIANAELAAQLIPSNAKQALDTLQEIAAWIQDHPEDAAEFNRLLAGLGTKKVIEGEGEEAKEVEVALTVKEYVDGVVGGEATARATAITTAIQGLDMTKVDVGAGETIKEISETDGVVSVTKQDIAITKSQITDFAHDHDSSYANKTTTETHISTGDIHVTADQKSSWTTGATQAGTAVQSVTFNGNEVKAGTTVALTAATGDANGQVKINGTNVDVKGLGSAAYTDATAYAGSTAFNEHVAKAVTTETYLLIDCGSSTVNVN